MSKINFYNMDNIEFMKTKPDNYYDLAIVDPPYGIGADKKNSKRKLQSKKSASLSNYFGNQNWDNNIPTEEYFKELFRVSKRQIIWGANYFRLKGGMIYWHKNVTMPTYSTGELAWVSWQTKINFVDITWHGMLQHDMKNKEIRIHPTQKPKKLYEWLLKNYAEQGNKILDTHGGSGNIALACYKYKFDLDIVEIDKDYFDASKKRFNDFISQLKLW